MTADSSPATRQHRGGLSARQLAILRLIASGLTSAEVAAELHISHHTVAQHIAEMLRRLGARTRGELIARAYVNGILAVDSWPPLAASAADQPHHPAHRPAIGSA